MLLMKKTGFGVEFSMEIKLQNVPNNRFRKSENVDRYKFLD